MHQDPVDDVGVVIGPEMVGGAGLVGFTIGVVPGVVGLTMGTYPGAVSLWVLAVEGENTVSIS